MRSPELRIAIDTVFAHWQKVMDHPTAKLVKARESKIRERLKEGYSVDQITAAIDGCRRSKFHMGDNDAGIVYDDLTLICRNGAKLEFFMNMNARLVKSETCGHCENTRRVQVNDFNSPCPKCRPNKEAAFWKSRGR